jgi:two-component system NtrC family response regulator
MDKIDEAENISQAQKHIENNEYDLVISDLRLPDEKDGLGLVKKIKQLHPLTPVLMITAYSSIDSAVQAMQAGADDYITKDFSRDEILIKIKKMLETRKLWMANIRLSEQVSTLKDKYNLLSETDQIIGESEPIKKVLDLVARVGQDNNSTVLITGESGTGKELIARSIHQNNALRTRNKFVVVDVANMPASLLESQLFGHEKGSFTNALQKHIGYFEVANGGTAFLDEIGDFPIELQVKLLRFLQEKTFFRVGGENSIHSDVRIVAATNKNLEEMVEKKRFREDLYYRLNVIKIHLPPLRERRDDIIALIHYFKNRFQNQKGRILHFPDNVLTKMVNYSWPGNVRQLKNLIESLYVLCPGDTVSIDDLKFENTISVNKNDNYFDELLDLPIKVARQKLIEKFESAYIKHHLKIYRNNISKMATVVGESREGLSKKIKRYSLKNEEK